MLASRGVLFALSLRQMWRAVGLLTVAAVLGSLLIAVLPSSPAAAQGSSPGLPRALAPAVSAADFQPGFIISDDLFYDGNAMTEAQIQAFLDQRIGTCQTNLCLNVFRADLPTYPAVSSSTTGNLICKEVSGGTNLRASTIIYRVQQACGISAKVILVTLQKEQGLISGQNSKAPSNYSLNYAMGWACPDSTGCVDASSWFGYQVYRGSRQLVTYKLARFARQPGVHQIQFHPDPSCGSTSVDVRNYATAALYNYTPYQPSAASLAAWPNAAPGPCHSYGNRNFFFFYNAWFGSTYVVDGSRALDEAYAAAGGVESGLGVMVAASACSVGVESCWRQYENGLLGWRLSTGAVLVSGEVFVEYAKRGGATGSLGLPVATASFFETDVNGPGIVQIFQGGYLYVSDSGRAVVRPESNYARFWAQQGWIRGAFGWPLADESCIGGVCSQ